MPYREIIAEIQRVKYGFRKGRNVSETAVSDAITMVGDSDRATADRPRVIVLTDYSKDPDDKQSMIRLLVYSNEFEIQGLIATSLALGTGETHPEWIKDTIDDYAQVLPNLRLHERPGHKYRDPSTLKLAVKRGAAVRRRFVGRGRGFPVSYPAGAKDSRECEAAEN